MTEKEIMDKALTERIQYLVDNGIRQWKRIEVPVGEQVRSLNSYAVYTITRTTKCRVIIEAPNALGYLPYAEILNEFEMLDHSPCGIQEPTE